MMNKYVNRLKKLVKHIKVDRKLTIIVVSIVILLVGLVYLFFFYDDGNYAAKVNGERISYEQLDEKVASLVTFYEQNEDDYDIEVLRNDSLDELIRQTLVKQHAEKNELSVADDAVEQYYSQRVNSAGSEEELLSLIEDQWGQTKELYLIELEYDLLRNNVQNSIKIPLADWLETELQEANIIINI